MRARLARKAGKLAAMPSAEGPPGAAVGSWGVRRLTALAGIGVFLLVGAGFVVAPVWEAPGSTSTAVRVSEYFRQSRAPLLVSLSLYSLAMGLFLCFAAGLRDLLGESPPGAATRAFAFGAVSLTTLVLAGFTPLSVLAYRPTDLAVVHPFYDLGFGLLALSGIPTVVCLFAYAVIVVRSAALPAWTAWLAIAGAIAHLAVAGSFLRTEGFFSLEGAVITVVPFTLFLWVLGVSIGLLRAPP